MCHRPSRFYWCWDERSWPEILLRFPFFYVYFRIRTDKSIAKCRENKVEDNKVIFNVYRRPRWQWR